MQGGLDIPHTDQRVIDLIHFLQKRNMDQVLPKGITTYKERRYKSIIDLVFATKLLVDSLVLCSISDKHNHDSNHLPILLTWNLRTIVCPLEKKKYFKKTDIKKLVNTLKDELTDSVQTIPKSIQKLDQQVDVLVAALIIVIDASTLMLRVSLKSIPSFDVECKEA